MNTITILGHFDGADHATIEGAIEKTLAHIQFTRPCEITVTLTDDLTIQKLNAQYRNKNKPTNVLSFSAYNPDEPHPPGHPIHLGDLVLTEETIQREAIEQNKSLIDHVTHLIIHGTLHLLGYDHVDDKDAAIMEGIEIDILKAMSIKNPYAD